jgi:hypothetical protein
MRTTMMMMMRRRMKKNINDDDVDNEIVKKKKKVKKENLNKYNSTSIHTVLQNLPKNSLVLQLNSHLETRDTTKLSHFEEFSK